MDLLLVALVLLSACGGPVWTAPTYCPKFQVVGEHQGFEKREYDPSWRISTPLGGSEPSDLIAAHLRLKNVASKADCWPVLINSTDDSHVTYSWFVSPLTTEDDITDPSVTLQSIPKATVYVRSYVGTPSIQRAKDEAKKLSEDVEGSGADANAFTWAGYDSYMSVPYHYEIWV